MVTAANVLPETVFIEGGQAGPGLNGNGRTHEGVSPLALPVEASFAERPVVTPVGYEVYNLPGRSLQCHIGDPELFPPDAQYAADHFVTDMYATIGTFFGRERNDRILDELASGQPRESVHRHQGDINVVVMDTDDKVPVAALKLVAPTIVPGEESQRFRLEQIPSGQYFDILPEEYLDEHGIPEDPAQVFEFSRLGTSNEAYALLSRALRRCRQKGTAMSDREYAFFSRYLPAHDVPSENTVEAIASFEAPKKPGKRDRSRPAVFMMACLDERTEQLRQEREVDKIIFYGTVVDSKAGGFMSSAGLKHRMLEIGSPKPESEAYQEIAPFFQTNKGHVQVFKMDSDAAHKSKKFQIARRFVGVPGRGELRDI